MLSDVVAAQIAFSEATPDHKAFIFHSWLSSFRDSDAAKRVRKNIYYNYQTERIGRCIAGGHVIVCHERDDPSHIYGWACYQNVMDTVTCLHYVFVKKPFRRYGIATELIEACKEDARSILYYSHSNSRPHTRYLTPWLEKKLGFNYNPYLA